MTLLELMCFGRFCIIIALSDGLCLHVSGSEVWLGGHEVWVMFLDCGSMDLWIKVFGGCINAGRYILLCLFA